MTFRARIVDVVCCVMWGLFLGLVIWLAVGTVICGWLYLPLPEPVKTESVYNPIMESRMTQLDKMMEERRIERSAHNGR